MFLSRSQEKIMCGKAEMNSSSSADVRGLSVDLTMGVPGSATSRVFAPTSVEFLPLASAALPDSINVNTVLTSSVSADAEQADPSCSQSGSMRNFDMNRLPSGAYEECGNYGTASSAVSIVSPFLSDVVIQNSKRDVIAWDGETGSKIHEEGINYISLTNNSSDHEDEEGDAAAGAPGGPPRKKLRLSKEQSALLEESFREHHTLNPKQKDALAKQLSLRSRQVEVWFQNRRARTKLKQTEVDCDFLKRCCESLTEENRRLQREVEELRAIKVAPPCVIAQDFYMPLPAATLTMCPSCERMGSTIDKRALTFTKPSYYLTNFRQPSAAC